MLKNSITADIKTLGTDFYDFFSAKNGFQNYDNYHLGL